MIASELFKIQMLAYCHSELSLPSNTWYVREDYLRDFLSQDTGEDAQRESGGGGSGGGSPLMMMGSDNRHGSTSSGSAPDLLQFKKQVWRVWSWKSSNDHQCATPLTPDVYVSFLHLHATTRRSTGLSRCTRKQRRWRLKWRSSRGSWSTWSHSGSHCWTASGNGVSCSNNTSSRQSLTGKFMPKSVI